MKLQIFQVLEQYFKLNITIVVRGSVVLRTKRVPIDSTLALILDSYVRVSRSLNTNSNHITCNGRNDLEVRKTYLFFNISFMKM